MGSRPALFPFRFFHSASNSWIWAESRSIRLYCNWVYLWNPYPSETAGLLWSPGRDYPKDFWPGWECCYPVFCGWADPGAALFPFRFFHSASNSWIWAESRSIIAHKSPVASVAHTLPRNPYFADRGGNVVIPSFAVGRTQELLYFIREIKERQIITGHPNFPVLITFGVVSKLIFFDSSLVTAVIKFGNWMGLIPRRSSSIASKS